MNKKVNKYTIKYADFIGLWDDDVIIEGVSPIKALEKYTGEKYVVCNNRKGDVLIWTGKQIKGYKKKPSQMSLNQRLGRS